jgi:hypothetical protein
MEREMNRYAAKTNVTPDRSMAEIETTLRRYGAQRFMYGRDEAKVLIAFEMHDRRLRFVLPIPTEGEFRQTPTGRTRRSKTIVTGQYEQAVRARYRALLLSIKAKLESVESGIEEFEDAFMAQIVLPDGSTVGERMKPQIETAYRTGTMPPLLPAAGATS